jgi:hypothetical protein
MKGPNMKLSPYRDEVSRAQCAGQAERAADTPRPAHPAPPDTGSGKDRSGVPEKPTDKPLPDLPNPAEVGEDG